ncbi:Uncharacterised protein [Helicobacter mustelae]|uniref:chemotaxis protein CheX n=1 Tax=Helicobacter mustelae TaxID=217 RepID=UPI000324138D|nr:chemotaxis protein CheX [Helicobacter mustelae]SQH71247.1 Uncharacterised protein [Helicobacter mustelae]STP12373.1 Uncharacterised protein [Helicobacter mustelae]
MELLRKSFIEVLKNTAGIVPQDSLKPLRDGYISSVELLESKKRVFIVANEEFLKLLSEKMILDDHPDEEVLIDMSKEFANLVVGHSKVLAEENGESFHISTPTFYGISRIHDYDKAIHFKFDHSRYCSIFVKA